MTIVCVCGGGGGGWGVGGGGGGGATVCLTGVIVACQYFETYPINIPCLCKNRPIHILGRPKCLPTFIYYPVIFYIHLLLVVRQIYM